jgi:hypothetical protein
MKVHLYHAFNPSFPEDFSWQLIDSPTLTNVAEDICREIQAEKKQPAEHRNLTPGLRRALRIISEIAEFVVC